MPKGGIITIRAENQARIVREDLTGDFVALAIQDTGTGMSPEIMEHIFEPFFTTEKRGSFEPPVELRNEVEHERL